MAGICPFIAAEPIVRAAHISARADALIRPAFPQPISVQTDRNDGRLIGPSRKDQEE
jgi:hypothetical protein